MSDDTGTAYARSHANGVWARVVRHPVSGQWLYGAGKPDADPHGARPNLAEAKAAADALAHLGCNGKGCTTWLGQGTATSGLPMADWIGDLIHRVDEQLLEQGRQREKTNTPELWDTLRRTVLEQIALRENTERYEPITIKGFLPSEIDAVVILLHRAGLINAEHIASGLTDKGCEVLRMLRGEGHGGPND